MHAALLRGALGRFVFINHRCRGLRFYRREGRHGTRRLRRHGEVDDRHRGFTRRGLITLAPLPPRCASKGVPPGRLSPVPESPAAGRPASARDRTQFAAPALGRRTEKGGGRFVRNPPRVVIRCNCPKMPHLQREIGLKMLENMSLMVCSEGGCGSSVIGGSQ